LLQKVAIFSTWIEHLTEGGGGGEEKGKKKKKAKKDPQKKKKFINLPHTKFFH